MADEPTAKRNGTVTANSAVAIARKVFAESAP